MYPCSEDEGLDLLSKRCHKVSGQSELNQLSASIFLPSNNTFPLTNTLQPSYNPLETPYNNMPPQTPYNQQLPTFHYNTDNNLKSVPNTVFPQSFSSNLQYLSQLSSNPSLPPNSIHPNTTLNFPHISQSPSSIYSFDQISHLDPILYSNLPNSLYSLPQHHINQSLSSQQNHFYQHSFKDNLYNFVNEVNNNATYNNTVNSYNTANKQKKINNINNDSIKNGKTIVSTFENVMPTSSTSLPNGVQNSTLNNENENDRVVSSEVYISENNMNDTSNNVNLIKGRNRSPIESLMMLENAHFEQNQQQALNNSTQQIQRSSQQPPPTANSQQQQLPLTSQQQLLQKQQFPFKTKDLNAENNMNVLNKVSESSFEINGLKENCINLNNGSPANTPVNNIISNINNNINPSIINYNNSNGTNIGYRNNEIKNNYTNLNDKTNKNTDNDINNKIEKNINMINKKLNNNMNNNNLIYTTLTNNNNSLNGVIKKSYDIMSDGVYYQLQTPQQPQQITQYLQLNQQQKTEQQQQHKEKQQINLKQKSTQQELQLIFQQTQQQSTIQAMQQQQLQQPRSSVIHVNKSNNKYV